MQAAYYKLSVRFLSRKLMVSEEENHFINLRSIKRGSKLIINF